MEAEHLEPRRQQPAEQQRTHEREQRRVGRARPLLEQQRPQPRAHQRAGREADQRERADDQSLHVAPEGHQQRESDDDPVQRRHGAVEGTLRPGWPRNLRLERRRRLTHRRCRSAALALIALAAGLLVGSAAETRRRPAGAGLRPRLGPRRLRGHARAAHRRGARALPAALVPGRVRERAPRSPPTSRLRVRLPEGRAAAAARRIPVDGRARACSAPVAGGVTCCRRRGGDRLGAEQVFPGLQEGERLTRRTEAPERATILSADGKVWPRARRAPGRRRSARSARRSPGRWARAEDRKDAPGAVRPRLRRATCRWALPAWSARCSATSRALPGARCARDLARWRASGPRRPRPVRSTIDTRVQQAAVTALAGRLGGIAALDTRTGDIRALAGVAFSAPQPPGSVFKIVTTAAALEEQQGQALRQVPSRVRRADRRRDPGERQRRALRGHLHGELRQVVQLGVRPARCEGGVEEAGRDRRALRLERQAEPFPGRRRARCPRRARSCPRWRSARRRSVSSRCWPRHC